MTSDPTAAARGEAPTERWLRRLLGSMSAFTMLMTIPQVWTIWIGHQAAGVSIGAVIYS